MEPRTQKCDIHIPPASAKYARRLFRDWANLTSSPDDARLAWFRKRHAIVFDFLHEHNGQDFQDLVTKIGGLLRLAWRETDEYQRDWYLFRARYRYEQKRTEYAAHQLAEFVEPYEAKRGAGSFWDTFGLLKTPFHTSMTILQTRLAGKMRCCRAEPCRGFKYFFQKRRNQKYCGTDCSEPALVESRRRWKAKNAKREKSLR